MTDLIKEFRELHAKTAQGEWTQANHEAHEGTEVFELESGNYIISSDRAVSVEDARFICKAHNELPRLLDELELVQRYVREQKARYQLGKLDRYKKALELCKEQRNEYCDSASYSARFITKEMIKSDDKEIEEILESEAADES